MDSGLAATALPLPVLPAAGPPIAVRKGNRTTCNPHPIYTFLSYHRLSSPYFAFVSYLSSVSIPKTTGEALSHPSGDRLWWMKCLPYIPMVLGSWFLSLPEKLLLDADGSMLLKLVPMARSIV
jgi:hypothetical protein